MSLWYFLSDWFAGVPTAWTLFKRSMINVAWAIAVLMAMAVLQAPVEYAAVVIYGVFIVNGVMFVVYHRQRERARD
jgi:hypothetical protein